MFLFLSPFYSFERKMYDTEPFFFLTYIYIYFLIGDVIMNFLNLFWSICYEGSLATTAASANAGGFLVCRISVQMWQQHDVIGCNCCEGVIKCQCANNLQIKEPSAPFPTSLFSRKCQPSSASHLISGQLEVGFLNNLFDVLWQEIRTNR